MSSQDPGALLRQVQCGERSRDDAAVRALLEARPDLRAELDSILAAQAAIEATARVEREVLQEAAANPAVSEAVHRQLEALAAGVSRARVRRARWAWAVGAAAVLLAAILIWSVGSPPLRRSDRDVLGREWQVRCVAMPSGYQVTWSGEVEPGGYFAAKIVDLRGTTLVGDERLTAPVWVVAASRLTGVTAADIRVVIHAYGADDRLQRSFDGQVAVER